MAGEKIRSDISVISIHYNDPEMLQASLHSLVMQEGVSVESIIVDNSGNFPAEELNDFPLSHQYLNPGYNSGFARGVNAGLKAATGKYILMLNQDATLTEPNAIEKCLDRLKSLPEKTIMGVNLVDAENQYQRSIWPEDPGFQKELQSSAVYIKMSGRKNPGIAFHRELQKQHGESGFVHRINGAFLLFHRSLVDQDKLFWDEDFFLYGEDVEWAHRCRKKGWRFYHFADVTAQHIGSASSSDNILKNLQVVLSDWLAVRKMKGRLAIATLLIFTWINRRIDLWLLRAGEKRGKVLSQEDKRSSLHHIYIQLYLVRKYFSTLVFANKLSAERDFLLNCYVRDGDFARSLG